MGKGRGLRSSQNAAADIPIRLETTVLIFRRLETPTVVWNSECRHMLGVVLRELEGPTPGLQELPAIEVHEVCVKVENLF